MKKVIIGVMGPGSEATSNDVNNALKIGELVAKNGWILLTGGMKKGVMGAANKGAKKNKGLTLGILPNDDVNTHSENLDISIITNMKSGRNYMNALSSHIMIACGMGAGTATEVSHAIQLKKPVILLGNGEESVDFFKSIGKGNVYVAETPEEAIKIAKTLI